MKKLLSVFLTFCLLLAAVTCLSACNNRGNYTSSDTATVDSQAFTSSEYTESEATDLTTSAAAGSQNSSSKKPSNVVSSKPSNANSSKPSTNSSSALNNVDSSESGQEQYDDISYTDVVCAETAGYKDVRFAMQSGKANTKAIFSIPMPLEWSFKKGADGYSIFRNSKRIGSVSMQGSSGSADHAVNVFNGQIEYSDFTVINDIDRVDLKGEVSFSRTLTFVYNDTNGKENSITLNVQYEELSGEGVMEIMGKTELSVSAVGTSMGILPITDNRNKILILGNSFVATSRVGSILQEMCGTDMMVEACSIGNATVSTFTYEQDILDRILSGNYSMVFMCGFYSSPSVKDFQTIVDVCQYSNTKLVVFPAHNETREHISAACLRYPYADVLDWKGEIDALIESGVSFFDLCYNDSCYHSTPLAGYVGAQMIYRAIYNKIPQQTDFSDVSRFELYLLKDYVSTGIVSRTEENQIYYLN